MKGLSLIPALLLPSEREFRRKNLGFQKNSFCFSRPCLKAHDSVCRHIVNPPFQQSLSFLQGLSFPQDLSFPQGLPFFLHPSVPRRRAFPQLIGSLNKISAFVGLTDFMGTAEDCVGMTSLFHNLLEGQW